MLRSRFLFTLRPLAFVLLAALPVVLAAACKRGGGGESTPAPTPGPPADREDVYLQLDVAIAGDTDPAALLAGWLAPGESLGGGVRWKPVPSALPGLAAAPNPVTADVYDDPGFLSIAFRGGAPFASSADLSALLSAVAARPEARGASLYLLDDRDGTVAALVAIAGHDTAEAAMALLDAWAPQLELSYAPEGRAEDGEVDRAHLVDALRAIPEVTGDLKRAPGATLTRDAGIVRVTFPHDTDTRSLGAGLVTRLGGAATPRLVAGTADDASPAVR